MREFMNRRDLLRATALGGVGLFTLRWTVACSGEPGAQGDSARIDSREDFDTTDAGHETDGARDGSGRTVTLYDTNAVALYFDGSQGPYTGVIKVAYVLANASITLDFWHGHGGVMHRFTLEPAHFAELKALRRVTLETTIVESHSHQLFIDPVDPTYRVPGATPVLVPI
jgi:hypothetical protein